MNKLRILVDSFADEAFTNAQMTNGREIVSRLDPERFHVTLFILGKPDTRIATRPNTTLIELPPRRQTVYILKEFIFGRFDILFYVKSSPASKLYLKLRKFWNDRRTTVGTVESQSDLRNEPTISAAAVRLWERTTLKCDRLFSNSSAVRDSLEKEYGFRSEIVPTGVDTEFFAPAESRSENNRPRVLFAGSLRPFKQPDILLQAAVMFPDADFIIVGDGPMRPELDQRIRKQGLGNVQLLGPMNAIDLREQYRGSDVFLFPSAWEGSPKVILEAAACGLPVIARKNYRPESVVDGETGFIVDSNEELFDRLELLLSDSGLRRRLGHAGREHAKMFEWDRITRQWEQVFLRLGPQGSID